MTSPILYLSLYLKRHQSEYYDRLSSVRTKGDWEGWTTFFLEGVAASADEATKTMPGDYTNLYATADLDLRNLIGNAGGPTLPTLPVPTLPIPTLPIPTLPIPTLPIPTLPTLPLPPVPGVGQLPGVPTSGATSACTGLLCLGQGSSQGSSQASAPADSSWLSLMRTGGAA